MATTYDLLLLNMNMMEWLLFAMIVLIAYIYIYPTSQTNQNNLPPGPICFPFLGTLPFLRGDVRKVLLKMAEKYGNVFTIYMGSTRVVVLSGYDVIREALLKRDGTFDARSDVLWKEFSNNKGIASSSGKLWKEQRRFTLHVLKNYGMGKRSMEGIITEEVTNMTAILKQNTDKPYNVHQLLQKSVTNIITNVAFGKRFDYEDPEYLNYIQLMTTVLRYVGADNPTTLLPFLRRIPGDPFNYHLALKQRRKLEIVYMQWIEDHKIKINNGEEPADLIGSYLNEMEKIPPNSDTTFSEEQLMNIIGDLFAAGTGTAVSTLTWALLYLVHYPDIQRKVMVEIDEIIGPDRSPKMEDKRSMPYTEAVISEVQRICDLVPLGIPHCTSQDTELRGYSIPKDTVIFPFLHSIHWDRKLWPEPDEFKPERFISDGKYTAREGFVPFSLGKRICLGQMMAKMELFLFLTNILQRFSVRVPDGQPKPSKEGILGLTFDCKPFDVVLQLR